VGSGDGYLYAINPNGTKKWSFRIGANIVSTPAFATDGTIYVGADDFNVYAINPDGSKKWIVTTGGAVSSSPAIGLDGTVYIGSQDQSLYAINPNGTVLWTFATTGGIYQSPAIGWDGTVYIPSVVFSLYAVGTSVDTVPLSGLTITPATVAGGVQASGVVTLAFAAPSGGAKVALQSNNGVASVPMFISVPAGSLTGAFTVTTAGISASSNAVITAISGGVAASATLKISAAALTALTLSPSTVVDTNPCTGTVTLSGAAPSGGLVVKLKSNSPHATVPATVTVPPGATAATFIITTSASIVSAIADITATYKTVTKSATLKIKT
jgi:hypothetical protein